MLRRRYVLYKVFPVISVFLIVLCLKNLLFGLQGKEVDIELEPKLIPQKALLEIPVKNKLLKGDLVGHAIQKPATEKQVYQKRKTGIESRSSGWLNKTCQNKECNFVFIKPMKCATETVVRILRKYSYDNDLNIMLPRKKRLYLAWPYLMDDSDYRLSDRPFNGLIDHAIYNKTIMNRYFPPETTHYVTIIREPLKHFKSAFNYFKVEAVAGIFAKQPLTEYLENIEYYESIYKSHEASTYRFCIPDGFSVTKNLLAHCLGMPLGYPKSRQDISNKFSAVTDYIQNLGKEFSLVMIVEYFHESLILFKRLMNWDLKDMIYKFVNRGTYFFSLNDHYKTKHKQWSPIDYMIYDYFNKTLWRKISAEGPDFFEEVVQFTLIQLRVNQYCWGVHKAQKTNLEIEQTQFNSHFSFTKEDCKMMDKAWLDEIKEKFDRDNQHVIDTRPELRKNTC